MLDKLFDIYLEAKKEYEEDSKVLNPVDIERCVFGKELLMQKGRKVTFDGFDNNGEDIKEIESSNIIALGDNYSYFLEYKKTGKKIDLVYMDPPFFSMSDYSSVVKTNKIKEGEIQETLKITAFSDNWGKGQGMEQYFKDTIKILLLTKDILSNKGVLWIHLDWHVVHYVKVIGDMIFGSDNFLNEIVWTYKSGGAGGKCFARKHDTLLVYSIDKKRKLNVPKEKSYNRGYKPYRFKGVTEYEDELGWYTLVNMKDVWQIDMVGRTSKERNGYATQKPQELLKRIISSSSEEGDICADFYGGSGAFAMACTELNRTFISCDKNKLSASLLESYILKSKEGYEVARVKKMESKERENFKGYNCSIKSEISIDPEANKTSNCGEKAHLNNISLKTEDAITSIVDYRFDIASLNINVKEKEKLVEIVRKKPLSLISYCQVFYQDKMVPITVNDKGVINLSFESDFIKLRVVDIFGNETIKMKKHI